MHAVSSRAEGWPKSNSFHQTKRDETSTGQHAADYHGWLGNRVCGLIKHFHELMLNGNSAAPFRAFMQHRALLASRKIPVGPMLYYFGSRHRSEEYLYGEEIEAYLQDGIITHAGLAFSRDEKRKVYIQHKMLQDGKMLAGMLGRKANHKGTFYLCGPTWPVPDVFEAIVGALGEYDGMERSLAEQYIEDLKEEERYVLEVY
jgi:sulfite reductase (NADPH) flavoprotein alpha-component